MMLRFKYMTKKLVAVVAAFVMAFLGMASCMTADAFYEDQGYCVYNCETKKISKYGLKVDLPIFSSRRVCSYWIYN